MSSASEKIKQFLPSSQKANNQNQPTTGTGTTADHNAPNSVGFTGYALKDPSAPTALSLIAFQPKNFQPDDVEIAITHCGVCGSDVHSLTQAWGETKLPLIAGHEIVGKVTRVGENVAEFRPGQRVGVGAQIYSCLQCRACNEGAENYCPGLVATYNGQYPDGIVTQGGYSTGIRAHQRWVFPIPASIESRHAAPMLCAGLTVFSPLKKYGAGPGKRVGVIGIGGLGHFAILFSKALGAETWAFTHAPSKIEDIKEMGADHVVNTTEKDFFKPLARTFDILLSSKDTFREDEPIGNYLNMLYVDGQFVDVGLPSKEDTIELHPFALTGNGASITGSHIGSKRECLEMLQFVAEKEIKPWVEELPMSRANEAIEGVAKNRVRYRYVLTQDIRPFE